VPDLKPGEKRYTYNKIKPAIMTLLAKLCKNRAEVEVRPDTNDDDRIEIAKAGLKYLHYQWNEDDMDHKTRRLKMHMLIDGFPVLKVYVDKDKGDDIPQAELEGLELDSLPTKTGKICTQVCDQFRIKIDPSAEDVSEIRWVLDEYPMDIDEIFDIWGKEVEEEDNISMRWSFDQFSIGETSKKFKNKSMVYDYWEMPCPKYPNGRRIVVSGDQVLEQSDDPGENPFIFFPAIPVPGRAIAEGVVTDMTTPQKSYNIKRTAEARILEEMGNPLWLLPQGSVEDKSDVVNEIGGIVDYMPINGAKPERVSGMSVDAGWQNAMERDEADLEDISGAHEISQGATPKGNNTLGGLQLQVEQDETKLAILVQSYEDGVKKWGEKVLRLVQKHFPEEQQLSIVGENGEIEAFTFSGADLTGGEIVDVVPGSSMPSLKAVEDQKVMEMWGAGMFTDPRTGMPDTRKVMRLLGESVASTYFDQTEQDENKALQENRVWRKAFSEQADVMAKYATELQVYQVGAQVAQQNGVDPAEIGFQPPQPPIKLPIVRDFYDHQTHIEAHNRFRKTNEYDDLPPEFQMIIDMHVSEHEQALMAPMMAQQQQQMQMQQEQMGQQQAMQEQQMQAEQAKNDQARQDKQADRDHQVKMKQMDMQSAMQQTQMKSQTALQQAALKQPGTM
jgi:hypothetical protein